VRKVRGRSISVRPRAGAERIDCGDTPVDPYRGSLYTPEELYDVWPYADSLDARAYAWSLTPPTPRATLAQALHDHAIDEALTDWLPGRRLVGVMGGHDLDRSSGAYADAARLGWMLGQEYVVATGGGPGAMEAANLGGFLGGCSRDDLAAAVASLAGVPSYRPSIDQWAAKAMTVRSGISGRDSVGIPTWFYGHEPPNVFATAIAKYFRNATREAILLQICEAGIVFLPGAGGTVQEIFQDACENYYATPESVAPMVLVGSTYWTETLPAWPLLQSLARGRPMEGHIHLVDTVDDAAALVVG
jgi:predicted Rossmann-fold nucleotide-binding protein